MKKKEEGKRLSDYDNTGQLGVTEMFGAITHMLLGGVKKPYKYYYQAKYQKRNTIVGYFMTIIFVGFLVYVLFVTTMP